ncbi:hypothetical protein A1O7_09993 [Cladophialophora yegresii CBS 114405]|uniref:Uncharacterized protein n=1 Tax=Cladophialophora yegresii CBS 114405 TaxID=1182544 RepID=W9VG92_9EURO|nr:uncharacterized protein A1O7_09993 [Cladophialophora yegresii CBS 114405]EXJ54652.1 hypothetical protein A1O7_09993 [Cladophialophora yegresii CBS 114405]
MGQDFKKAPAKEDIEVAVNGLGPGGLALDKSIAKVHRVCAFDYCWEGPHNPVKNIWWSDNPHDLSFATHFIIADSCSRRYTGREFEARVTDILWARSIIRAALVDRESPATIILASVVPVEGLTKKLLGEFHAAGHRLGVAPQVDLKPGTNEYLNGLPKVVGGIDRESTRSIGSLYESVFGRDDVFSQGKVEFVEAATAHGFLMTVALSARLQKLIDDDIDRMADEYGSEWSDEEWSDDEGSDKESSKDKRSSHVTAHNIGSPDFDLSEDSGSSSNTAWSRSQKRQYSQLRICRNNLRMTIGKSFSHGGHAGGPVATGCDGQ